MTSVCVRWLWQKSCRAIAPEIGLRREGLTSAWKSPHRVDLVGVAKPTKRGPGRVYLIEVKSTSADLAREYLDRPLIERQKKIRAKHRRGYARAAYRWEINTIKLGVVPYLAVDASVSADLYAFLPATWGVLSVRGEKVRVLRKPVPEAEANSSQLSRAWQALAESHSMWNLPRMNRRKPEAILSELIEGEYGNQWAKWGKRILALAEEKNGR